MSADEHRFATAYERHLGAVSRYVARRCGPEDVSDVVADVFVVAWRRCDDMPKEPETRAWLLGVARWTLSNHRRQFFRRRRLARTIGDHLRPRLEGAPAERRQDLVEVLDAIDRLSDRDRELVVLTAWDQLSVAEAAVVVGLTPAAGRKRLERARRKLRQELGTVDGGAPPPRQRAPSSPGSRLRKDAG